MASEQVLISLLNQKSNLLQNANDIGMIWWTTTIVFSVSIIGILWKVKDEIRTFTYINALIFAITIFYFSEILFGIWMIIAIHQVEKEATAIMGELNLSEHLMNNFGFLGSKIGFLIGVTNFCIITYFWWRFSTFLKSSNKC